MGVACFRGFGTAFVLDCVVLEVCLRIRWRNVHGEA